MTSRDIYRPLSRHARLQWSAADETKLQELCDSGAPLQEIARRLNRSVAAVRIRANMLGISTARPRTGSRAWTEAQDEFIRVHYPVKRGIWVAQQIGRSLSAVRARAQALGVYSLASRAGRPVGASKTGAAAPWSTIEDGILERACDQLRAGDSTAFNALTKTLDRGISDVMDRIRELGLKLR